MNWFVEDKDKSLHLLHGSEDDIERRARCLGLSLRPPKIPATDTAVGHYMGVYAFIKQEFVVLYTFENQFCLMQLMARDRMQADRILLGWDAAPEAQARVLGLASVIGFRWVVGSFIRNLLYSITKLWRHGR